MSPNTLSYTEVRKLRREMVKQLEAQQQADSKIAGEIRDRILAGNKTILDSLSKLLCTYSAERTPSHSERSLFKEISHNSVLEDWLLLRHQHLECTKEKLSCQAEKQKASDAYGQHSPVGRASRWFMDEADKNISKALKYEKDRLSSKLELIESRHNSLEVAIQSHAEVFMRDSMNADALAYICRVQNPVQFEIKATLQQMSETVNQLWTTHAASQVRSLSTIASATATILEHYKRTPATQMLLKG